MWPLNLTPPGFPSVGKSSLLTLLTGTESEAAAYEFTTLTCIPGVIHYNESKIQLLDLPGIIEGASEGKGRGRQVGALPDNGFPPSCSVVLLVHQLQPCPCNCALVMTGSNTWNVCSARATSQCSARATVSTYVQHQHADFTVHTHGNTRSSFYSVAPCTHSYAHPHYTLHSRMLLLLRATARCRSLRCARALTCC